MDRRNRLEEQLDSLLRRLTEEMRHDDAKAVEGAIEEIEVLERHLGKATADLAALEDRFKKKLSETRYSGAWTCPECGDVLGAGLSFCEGLLLDEQDGGDCRHERIYAPWVATVRGMSSASPDNQQVGGDVLDILSEMYQHVHDVQTGGAGRAHRIRDLACADCMPDSEQVVEGFKCFYHAAAALLRSNGRLPGTADGG